MRKTNKNSTRWFSSKLKGCVQTQDFVGWLMIVTLHNNRFHANMVGHRVQGCNIKSSSSPQLLL